MERAEKAKLLVVDDEFFNRDLLARRLQRAGFEVETAASAGEAMAALERQTFELVLLDNMMPGMTGLGLLKLLRGTAATSDLPVIMVTALNESERVVEALNSGANDYVTKPIDFPVALARINSQLHRRGAERALRESEERYSLAARGSNDGLWDWNLRTGAIFYSPRWKEMIGWQDAVVGNSSDEWLSRVHPEDRAGLLEELSVHRAPNGPNEFVHEHRLLHRDGEYRWMLSRALVLRGPDGVALRMAGSQTDVTRNKAFDALTGLPNRVLFQETVARQLGELRAGRAETFAVLFLDLDRFKIVNDSLGHSAGDRLLVEVARRLRSSIRTQASRNNDFVARLGGDEFGVVITNQATELPATLVAARLLEALAEPLCIDGREVFTGASIGIADALPSYDDPAELLRDADTAMYQAKSAGRGCAVVFEGSMRTAALERLDLESALKLAIEQDEFRLYYQPKMDLAASRLVGFEALIRWEHPEKGLMNPDCFIPLAEETGLILPIGEWVIGEACRTVKRWQEQCPLEPPLEMSVNLSVRQFRDPQLTEKIQRALDETGIPPASLNLEVTESVLIQDFDGVSAVFERLKALGVGLKVDDFGTGYSSLQYLSQLPFDALKIDRSFVMHICQGTQALDVVRTIVDLARSLRMEVVAEGIETVEQVQQLRSLGCGYGQGFYFSKPVPADEALRLIIRESSNH